MTAVVPGGGLIVHGRISTFSVVDIPEPPRSRAATAPVAAGVRPDVATNTRVNRHGRTYLILLDSFAIDPGRTLVVRKFLRDFIERYHEQLEEEHGSVEAYLVKAGLDEARIERLRKRLHQA